MSSIEQRSASVIAAIESDRAALSSVSDTASVDHERSSRLANDPVGSDVDTISAPAPPAPAAESRSQDSMQTSMMVATSHPEPVQSRNVAPVPRITIQAFCDGRDVLAVLEAASRDRLMTRASLEVHEGGIRAAAEFCRRSSVPNLLIVESRASNDTILAELEELAEVCDPATRVLVIGYSNDIPFYRELLRRGISEYTVAPVGVVALIATISGIYRDSSSGKLGQVYAFVGAKGGVGSSTVAHNIAWTMARRFEANVVLADLDLPFGTAGLDFNLEANQGIADAIQDSGRLDEVLLDRLLIKCDDHLSLLTAPAKLDRPYDLDANAFGTLLEIAQANVPFTILDVPHVWTSWARNALVAADEIVITAAPDLANLRNAKNLIGFLRAARPHDAPPKLVMNQVGMAKRPEIKPGEFARALELEPLASIPFDAHSFGAAANNGKMIAAISAKSPAVHAFTDVAAGITGRKEQNASKRMLFNFGSLLTRNKRSS
jgi:pilus assembly protein CpaE